MVRVLEHTETVINALIKQAHKLPMEFYISLTCNFYQVTQPDRRKQLMPDLAIHSQAKLNAVARRLNERPGKTLEYETPAVRFNACVASTG